MSAVIMASQYSTALAILNGPNRGPSSRVESG
jgi:hypothetical protein